MLGIMSSAAGKFVSEAAGTRERKPDEVAYLQIANLEPQELMQFLDFCARKIHERAVPRRLA
jgi:hypothetical protein